MSNTLAEPRPIKVDEQDTELMAQTWMNEIQRRLPRRNLNMHYSCANEAFDQVFLDFYSKEHVAARFERRYKLQVKDRADGDPNNQILLTAPNGIRWEITFRLPTGRPPKVQENL